MFHVNHPLRPVCLLAEEVDDEMTDDNQLVTHADGKPSDQMEIKPSDQMEIKPSDQMEIEPSLTAQKRWELLAVLHRYKELFDALINRFR